MIIRLTFLTLLFSVAFSYGQSIHSGEYEFGLKLAYDKDTKTITGYFENYTGFDEQTNSPKFSCIFYIEGSLTKSKVKIRTFYPGDNLEGSISGTLEAINDTTLKISLLSEHGGCWNVQHFADEPVHFELEKKANWTQIKYVIAEKTALYSEKNNAKKRKAYIVKNDFVCIDKIEEKWAHCTFFGKIITEGWVRLNDLK